MAVHGSSGYKLVRLVNGAHSVHSLAHHETFHPVVGPVAEAEALYVNQLRIPEQLRVHQGDYVVWDVGLGAAANAVTVLRASQNIACNVRLVSFDHTLEPLEFALEHPQELEYLTGYEAQLRTLIDNRLVQEKSGPRQFSWEVHVADFPTFLANPISKDIAKPHLVMFDAFSPAKNPAMWTQPLFANLFALLDPNRPCALPTYSRSTSMRVTLLLAGFFVGVGHATGKKEETTVAANDPRLIAEPLDQRWLQRVRRSGSAEPMWEPVYRQTKLSDASWEKLCQHPQFR